MIRKIGTRASGYRTLPCSFMYVCFLLSLLFCFAGCATEPEEICKESPGAAAELPDEGPPEVISLTDYLPVPAAPFAMEPPLPPFKDPGPLPEPKEYVIVFTVEPEEGYLFEDGYITASYQDDPPVIAVEYGHREVDGANTKWYSHEVNLDGKVYRKTGKNSIPFVRGRDNLWWNEEQLKLPAPIQKTIDVLVTDNFRNMVHRFIVRKEVRVK